eukprot:1160045-Pelagomonas_calceolata.AAC.10
MGLAGGQEAMEQVGAHRWGFAGYMLYSCCWDSVSVCKQYMSRFTHAFPARKRVHAQDACKVGKLMPVTCWRKHAHAHSTKLL